MPKQPIDLTGATFERWTVLGRAERRKGQPYWRCQCTCGTIKDVYHQSLTRKLSRSCGCLISDVAAVNQFRHGHGDRHNRSPTYTTWATMKARCLNPHRADYHRYGGRGITVCDRWRNSFEAFLSDMGERPSAAHSLDRIENTGCYHPENCRWATASQQARNRRSSRVITFNGETKTLAEWAQIKGLNAVTIGVRINRLGWSVERALTTPAGPNGKKTYKLPSHRLDKGI